MSGDRPVGHAPDTGAGQPEVDPGAVVGVVGLGEPVVRIGGGPQPVAARLQPGDVDPLEGDPGRVDVTPANRQPGGDPQVPCLTAAAVDRGAGRARQPEPVGGVVEVAEPMLGARTDSAAIVQTAQPIGLDIA